MTADPRLDDLVKRWQQMLQRGEQVILGELCADCPELLPALRERVEPITRRDPSALVASPSQWEDPPADPAAFMPTRQQESAPDHPQRSRAHRMPTLPGYEMLGQLGRGGFGVVYKARDMRLNRLVAVKMILAGAHATPLQLARFHVEAEALASLRHPNIILVHDSGEFEACPFIVLEFVEGGTLDERLSGRPQPAKESATLVETLARAIHVAHLRGIIHRDLKPSNVLLTAEGTPKISDFGLARRLQDDSNTVSGSVLGTPSYMAPEQALGHVREIDPATDVYSLGAILYELLTGQPPFDGPTYAEALWRVQHEEVVSPSRVGRQAIPWDLETICMKCLDREQARRYATALELAEDLRRFLDGEPIRARPVSLVERTVKWVRRRPAITALIVVTLIASIGLLTVGLWSYAAVKAARDRAEQRSALTRRALDDLYEVAALSRDDATKEAFLRTALAIYEQLAAEEPANDELRDETAQALFHVAQIARELGDYERSEQAFARAIGFQERLLESKPSSPQYRKALADSHNWLGDVCRSTNRPDLARMNHETALELRQDLAKEFPDEPRYRHDVAQSEYNLALLSDTRGEDAVAERRFQRAAEMLATVVADTEPRADLESSQPVFGSTGIWRALNLEARQSLARVSLNQGQMYRRLKRFPEARQAYRRATAELVVALARSPHHPDYRFDRALTENNFGNLLAADLAELDEAEHAYVRAQQDLAQLIQQYPRRPAYREELANTFNGLGSLHVRSRKFVQTNTESPGLGELLAFVASAAERGKRAEEAFVQSIAQFRSLHQERQDKVEYEHGLGMAEGNLGWLYLRHRKDAAAARTHLISAAAYVRGAMQKASERASYRRDLAPQLRFLADADIDVKDHAGASEAVEELVQVSDPETLNGNRLIAAMTNGRCARLNDNDAAGDPALRRKRSDHYIQLALNHLQAINPSLVRNPTEALADEAFDGLRSYPEFQSVAEQWKKRAAEQR